MLHSLYTQIGLILLCLSCGLAIWKGQQAERYGAILILATWLITLAGSFGAERHHPPPAIVFLVSDGLLALGLLILALLYSSWWMGAAMLLQAVSLAFHAAFFAADQSDLSHHTLNLYVLGMDVASVTMLVVLLAATVAGMLKRRKARSIARSSVGAAAVAG